MGDIVRCIKIVKCNLAHSRAIYMQLYCLLANLVSGHFSLNLVIPMKQRNCSYSTKQPDLLKLVFYAVLLA